MGEHGADGCGQLWVILTLLPPFPRQFLRLNAFMFSIRTLSQRQILWTIQREGPPAANNRCGPGTGDEVTNRAGIARNLLILRFCRISIRAVSSAVDGLHSKSAHVVLPKLGADDGEEKENSGSGPTEQCQH